MTNDLERAIEAVKTLSPERQDDLARLMMVYSGQADDETVYDLSPDEEADLRVGLDQADRGEFATPEKIAATWARYRG